jgi:hypothetical protein
MRNSLESLQAHITTRRFHRLLTQCVGWGLEDRYATVDSIEDRYTTVYSLNATT